MAETVTFLRCAAEGERKVRRAAEKTFANKSTPCGCSTLSNKNYAARLDVSHKIYGTKWSGVKWGGRGVGDIFFQEMWQK